MFEIKIDNEVIFTCSDIEEQIVKDSVVCYKEWIKRGWVNELKEKIESSMKRLDEVWLAGGKLADNGVESIPTARDARAALIFEQPNYQDRATRG